MGYSKRESPSTSPRDSGLNTNTPSEQVYSNGVSEEIIGKAIKKYNIPREKLSSASQITPGKRAPTITALEQAEWVAVSAMVEKKKIATVMDELTKVGATDILVLKIENTRSGF